MSTRACRRILVAALLTAAFLPGRGLAVPKIQDDNGVIVGVIRGATNFEFRILIADGDFLVPLRVARNQLIGPHPAFFTTTDCTGTSYVGSTLIELGINKMYNRVYVTRGAKSKLWRTKPNNPVVSVDIQSRYDFDSGGCALVTFTDDMIAADKFVRSLEDDFPPPYTVVGTP